MAEKDIDTKKLEDYTDVFSDIYNTLLFKQTLLKPESLKAGPTESVYKLDSDQTAEQRRDTLKEYQDSMHLVIAALGIENQAAQDKYMPVRIMSYDAGSYKQQVKAPQKQGNRVWLYPVITIVLNFSEEPWKEAVGIRELVKVPPGFEDYVQDYGIHVFDVAFLEDDTIESFHSDFGIAARFFKDKRLGNRIKDTREIKHVGALLDMLSAFTKDERYRDTVSELEKHGRKGEAVSMCTVLQGWIDEGIARGLERGIEQGTVQARVRMIADFLRNGGTAAQAEQMLNAGEEEIAQAEALNK